MMSRIHIVGPATETDGRILQRCSRCGEAIIDEPIMAAEDVPDVEVTFAPPVWEPGELVQIDFAPGDQRRYSTPDAGAVPTCALVEAIQ